MITADQLCLLTNMPPVMLTEGLRRAGYKKDKIEISKFVGITNAGQFCYACEYINQDDDFEPCQVFVTYDPTADKVSIGY